jgi:hypothetical protein
VRQRGDGFQFVHDKVLGKSDGKCNALPPKEMAAATPDGAAVARIFGR